MNSNSRLTQKELDKIMKRIFTEAYLEFLALEREREGLNYIV